MGSAAVPSNPTFPRPQGPTTPRLIANAAVLRLGNYLHRRLRLSCTLRSSSRAYIAQIGTKGQLLTWGAKVNRLIDKGEIWRLLTCSFMHANAGHLLVNCYSLNSIGPEVEKNSGPIRYIAVYMISALASSTCSYWFSKAPAIGASGAIYGLVGSFAVFVLRHRGILKGTEGRLKYIAQTIALNMSIGLLSKGIDNWGHLGGLVGGAATAWLLGPALKLEYDGKQRFLTDKAPIFSFIKGRKNTP